MNRDVVLCVDDDVILVMALKEELRQILGDQYLYEIATSAEEGINIIE